MCRHELLTLSLLLVLKVKQQVDSSLLIQVVAGSVMESASMMFHGVYKKRCLLTILVSQILLLTQLISEIKTLLLQMDFSLQKVLPGIIFASTN